MICPFCKTENRDDRETCYYCNKDLSMLRLIVNKAKHHYNQSLEFAERGRFDDAIGELKNALDLDASLAGAHVVLGTLYAKKEMFAEARECWKRALALNHHFDKAHDYLIKAQSAEHVFPQMKRLSLLSKALAAVALIAVLALTALVIVLLRPDPSLNELRRVIRGLNDGGPNAGQALGELENLARHDKSSAEVRELAEALQEQVRGEWQERINLASSAIRNNDPYFALQVAYSLEAKSPTDNNIKNSVRRTREAAIQMMVKQVRESADQFTAGSLPFEKLSAEAQRFLGLVKSGPEKQKVEQMMAQAEGIQRDRLLTEAGIIAGRDPIDKVVSHLKNLDNRYHELAQKLPPLLDTRLKAEAARAEEALNEAMRQEQFDRANRLIADLELMYQTAQRPVPDKLTAQFKSKIAEVRRRAQEAAEQKAREEAEAARRQALAEAEQLFTNKEWENFINRMPAIDALTTGTPEAVRFAEMNSQARANFANDMWKWYYDRHDLYESGRISPEEAKRTLTTYKAVLAHLPNEKITPPARVYFYAAASHYRQGQPSEAHELLTQLIEKYPKSFNIVRPAKQLLQQIDKEQQQQQPAAQDNQTTASTAQPPQPTASPTPEGPKRIQPVKKPRPRAVEPSLVEEEAEEEGK